jgi:hypothetical protein
MTTANYDEPWIAAEERTARLCKAILVRAITGLEKVTTKEVASAVGYLWGDELMEWASDEQITKAIMVKYETAPLTFANELHDALSRVEDECRHQ